MGDEIREIAARIREMREISDYSVEEMAREVGIEPALYESYEAAGGNIPISTMYRIANVFGVEMSELLTGRTPRIDTYAVVKKGKGEKIDRFPGYNFRGLAYKFKDKIMEPMIVSVDPSEVDPELVTHPGQEFNLVLKGSIELLYDDKRIVLEKGDSVYFDPTHPHGQKAMNALPAVFLTVIAE